MQNAKCKIVVYLRYELKITGEADTIIVHSAFYILHS